MGPGQKTYRSKVEVIRDILLLIKSTDVCRKRDILYHCNLSGDSVASHIALLEKNDLILHIEEDKRTKDHFIIRPKGQQYLDMVEVINGLVKNE
jgi:predicted transcriptional regulator